MIIKMFLKQPLYGFKKVNHRIEIKVIVITGISYAYVLLMKTITKKIVKISFKMLHQKQNLHIPLSFVDIPCFIKSHQRCLVCLSRQFFSFLCLSCLVSSSEKVFSIVIWISDSIASYLKQLTTSRTIKNTSMAIVSRKLIIPNVVFKLENLKFAKIPTRKFMWKPIINWKKKAVCKVLFNFEMYRASLLQKVSCLGVRVLS